MKIFVVTVGVVLALFLADQALLWMERRHWIYWRRAKAGIGAASSAGIMGELHTLFSPTHRHVNEEKGRRLVLRDDTDAGAPPNREIDLESGRVRVVIPNDPPQPPAQHDDGGR
ncbi:DUF6191 domain-containing protein [Streptomyces sp. NPDC047315]|uniref:DUF6191 domain-containing protein n=1 Tax=Streptomyces sp. NPDC047315 TaxID=3155142 RepID=UPI0033EED3F6